MMNGGGWWTTQVDFFSHRYASYSIEQEKGLIAIMKRKRPQTRTPKKKKKKNLTNKNSKNETLRWRESEREKTKMTGQRSNVPRPDLWMRFEEGRNQNGHLPGFRPATERIFFKKINV